MTGRDAVLGELELDFIRKRAYLRSGVTCADYKIVGDNGLFFNVQELYSLRSLRVENRYDELGELFGISQCFRGKVFFYRQLCALSVTE